MFDYELVVEVLDQLDQACNKILSRFANARKEGISLYSASSS